MPESGFYLRIKRDGEWIHELIENLTDEERIEAFAEKDRSELLRWINGLCQVISS